MIKDNNYQSLSAHKKKWLYNRYIIKSNSAVRKYLRIIIRLILIIVSLPKVLFYRNVYIATDEFGKNNFKKCFVCTKNNQRVLNIFKNTLSGFHFVDYKVTLTFTISNLNRIKSIFHDSINNDFYSIVNIAEVYDFYSSPNYFYKDYDYYATSDGASPLNKIMCLYFKNLQKTTMRIVNHSSGPKVDMNYDYNFITESFAVKTGNGWIKIKGTPWIFSKSARDIEKKYIGVVGSPGPLNIFGLEYRLLLAVFKLKLNGLTPKIRLHPQASNISKFLIIFFLRVKVSNHKKEDENAFFNSINALLSSYRTSLIDLALIRSCPVVMFSKKTNIPEREGIHLIDTYEDIKNVILGAINYNANDKKNDMQKIEYNTIYEIVISKRELSQF